MSGTRDRTADGPVWALKHRPASGGRWSTVAAGITHAEAVALIDGPGDWWVAVHKTAPTRKHPTRKLIAATADTPSLFAR